MALEYNRIFDRVLKVLIFFGILLLANAARISYLYILSNGGSLQQNALFLTMFAVLFSPLLYIAGYIISLVFIFKKQAWAYLLSCIISVATLVDGVQSLLKANYSFNFMIVVTIIFWLALIVLSFMRYSQLKAAANEKPEPKKKKH